MTKQLACLPLARLMLASLVAAFSALPIATAVAQTAATQPTVAQPAVAQPAVAQQVQPLDKIVAVVDEDVILQSELDRAVGAIQAQYANRQIQLPPRAVLERQVLDRLVLTRLQVARAEDNGIHVSDAQVDDAVANVAKQNNLSLDQLQAQVAHDGMTMSDLRNSIHDEIEIQQLKQSFARSRISVSEGEVDAALAAKANSKQYHLAHILVALPDGATPDQIAIAEKKINDIKAQLDQQQIDFSAAAVRYSDSPNALEGGDLGWRDLDQIPAAFAQTISSMQDGQVIGPIRGPSGFQLVQMIGSRDGSAADNATITQFRARHILIKTADPSNDAADAAAKAKLETLRARIAGGADFADVARENSDDDNTAGDGGELGWFAQDAYGVDFGAQVAALQDGQVSAPFHTQAGWHIVQREGSRQASAADENRRQQVRESIGQRKLEEEWDRFLREMRGEAYVDIRLPPLQVGQATPSDGS